MLSKNSRRRPMGVENFLDLAGRAREGRFVHSIVWLLIGWSGQLELTSPQVYFGLASAFVLIVIVRLRFEMILARAAATDRAARAGFIALMLSNPVVWSVATVLSVLWPEMADCRLGILFAVVALAAAAGMALVIEPVVRRAYPALTLVPGSFALWLHGSREDHILAAMAMVMMVYVLRASNVVHADYWNAADARAALEHRAAGLELLSNTDALTQLRNRPHFDKHLAAEWARSRRSKVPLALLIIDLDHFKRINDGHGHAVGDASLQAVAVALQDALHRPEDLLARYGGEEFAAMVPAITHEGAAVVAERMRLQVAAIDFQHEGQRIPLSCSIGMHTVTDFERCTIAQALACADQAMYDAKEQGRNRIVATRG